MFLLPLNQLPIETIRLIASDVDGTLTRHEKFTPALLATLNNLAAAGISCLLITGRSAGWVQALQYYLPVTGAIAENGGVYFTSSGTCELLSPVDPIGSHRQALAEMFFRLQQQFPNLQASADNRFRLTDWTFDVGQLTPIDLDAISIQCQDFGWSFTYSTVQCHIKPALQDKAAGLQQVLQQQFPQLTPEQVLTIGDSPNDASLFDSDMFPHSVGVANILAYRDRLPHLPRYVTTQLEAEGFCEFISYLLNKSNSRGVG